VLLTVKSNQKTLYRQIGCQFQGKRHIPFTATDHEKHHGRDTVWELQAKEAPEHIKANWPGSAWIVEVITDTLTRKGKRIGLPTLQRCIQPAGLGLQEGDRLVWAPAGLTAAAGIALEKLQDADLLQLRAAVGITHQHSVGIGGVVDQLLGVAAIVDVLQLLPFQEIDNLLQQGLQFINRY
jgi:hypothetical protein